MTSLAGRRILVVEDEILLGLDVEHSLQDAGCTVIGPCPSLASAQTRLAEPIDAAVLDITIRGESSFPIADALTAAGIPFVVLSGHSISLLPPQHRTRPFLSKPCNAAQLLQALDEALHGPAVVQPSL